MYFPKFSITGVDGGPSVTREQTQKGGLPSSSAEIPGLNGHSQRLIDNSASLLIIVISCPELLKWIYLRIHLTGKIKLNCYWLSLN